MEYFSGIGRPTGNSAACREAHDLDHVPLIPQPTKQTRVRHQRRQGVARWAEKAGHNRLFPAKLPDPIKISDREEASKSPGRNGKQKRERERENPIPGLTLVISSLNLFVIRCYRIYPRLTVDFDPISVS